MTKSSYLNAVLIKNVDSNFTGGKGYRTFRGRRAIRVGVQAKTC